MPRRKTGAFLFEPDEPERSAPAPDHSEPVQEVAGNTEASSEAEATGARRPAKKPKAARVGQRAARQEIDPEETQRDYARRLLKGKLKSLLKFQLDVATGKAKNVAKTQMDANEKLLELILDKTPTAQPVISKRNRILVGFAGAVPGRYPGGGSVLKDGKPMTAETMPQFLPGDGAPANG